MNAEETRAAPPQTNDIVSRDALSERSSAAPATIVTRVRIDAPREQVWRGLAFYEQIADPPPWYLRLILPVPLGTHGEKAKVGGLVTCLYERGHLIKRITRIEEGFHYGFEVSEQKLEVAGVRLHGGSYSLRELTSEWTEVAVTTRYTSPRRPRRIARMLEAAACHLFHRHLVASILRALPRSS